MNAPGPSDSIAPPLGAAPSPTNSPPASPAGLLRGETLAQGLVLVIVLAGGQRMIGFVRGVLFCRWLPAEELGTWDLAFGFLLLAAPLAVLGIPGALGRYVEHYRQRGQLRRFLRGTLGTSLLLAALGVGLILLARRWFGWFIFDDPQRTPLVVLLTACLLTVIANNFLVELFTALRQMRVVSLITLGNSVLFASIGLALLAWRGEAAMVVVAYMLATLLTSLAAAFFLLRQWKELPGDEVALPTSALWSKLLPFAAWVWVTNLLINLFAVADRYMIVHFSGLDTRQAAAMVGNYHTSRVVPLLLVSLAGMLGGMILPHLSRDWERGRRHAVSRRLNLILKTFALALMAAAVAILAAAPLLFGVVLSGRYAAGLDVLPWTLTYCVWFSLALIVESYLWCAERPRMACLIYFLGLGVNIALNVVLLPLWGLPGAVIATAAGNAVALALAIWLCHRLELERDGAVWLVAVLPLTLLLGVVPAAVSLAVVIWLAGRGTWFFTPEQKDSFADSVRHSFSFCERAGARAGQT